MIVPRATCVPEKKEDYWICTCNSVNRNTDEQCASCWANREDLFAFAESREVDDTQAEVASNQISRSDSITSSDIITEKSPQTITKSKKKYLIVLVSVIAVIVIAALLFSALEHRTENNLSNGGKIANWVTKMGIW